MQLLVQRTSSCIFFIVFRFIFDTICTLIAAKRIQATEKYSAAFHEKVNNFFKKFENNSAAEYALRVYNNNLELCSIDSLQQLLRE